MDQKIIKGEHYDLRELTMQSTTERDQYRRSHPDEVPAGFRRVCKWTEDMKLVVGVEKIPAGEPAKVKEEAAAGPKPADFLPELEKLDMADLLTLAPQHGITNPPKKEPELRAAIARKMAEAAGKK